VEGVLLLTKRGGRGFFFLGGGGGEAALDPGDGRLNVALQELATGRANGITPSEWLFKHGAFGNVMRDETRGFGGRVIGAQLRNPIPSTRRQFAMALATGSRRPTELVACGLSR